jgi:hypothetical protein
MYDIDNLPTVFDIDGALFDMVPDEMELNIDVFRFRMINEVLCK